MADIHIHVPTGVLDDVHIHVGSSAGPDEGETQPAVLAALSRIEQRGITVSGAVSELSTRLTNIEGDIARIKETSGAAVAEKDAAIAELRAANETVLGQLTAALADDTADEATIADLRAQLDAAATSFDERLTAALQPVVDQATALDEANQPPADAEPEVPVEPETPVEEAPAPVDTPADPAAPDAEPIPEGDNTPPADPAVPAPVDVNGNPMTP